MAVGTAFPGFASFAEGFAREAKSFWGVDFAAAILLQGDLGGAMLGYVVGEENGQLISYDKVDEKDRQPKLQPFTRQSLFTCLFNLDQNRVEGEWRCLNRFFHMDWDR